MLTLHFASSVVLSSILFADFGSATPIGKFERQHIEDEYDFVICGGGTAGLVVANRLSEIASQKILVLEAGPDPSVVAAYETPGGNLFLGGTAIDYNFYTEPQEFLGDRILPYHRELAPNIFVSEKREKEDTDVCQAAEPSEGVASRMECTMVVARKLCMTTGKRLVTLAGAGTKCIPSSSR